jgi:hypothetical protein
MSHLPPAHVPCEKAHTLQVEPGFLIDTHCCDETP